MTSGLLADHGRPAGVATGWTGGAQFDAPRSPEDCAQRSQIECESMCRWSTAASAAGDGINQMSSIRTRPHQAQAGRIWPASNAVQMRKNVSLESTEAVASAPSALRDGRTIAVRRFDRSWCRSEQEEVAFDDGGGDVAELAAVVL